MSKKFGALDPRVAPQSEVGMEVEKRNIGPACGHTSLKGLVWTGLYRQWGVMEGF